ncbi:MAG: cytochrome c biogenesis protein ResB [Elusimicrobia bacterium]|nr:cytochrome c biogenesis protein ResB [Elusimicrobiota bacterium]
MAQSLRIFRSVKFNVGLVLAIVAASAIGTFLPQLSETPEKVDLFLHGNPFWGKIFQALGFFDIYHTKWFMGMLGLIAFDIVVCKLWKLPPDNGLTALPPEFDPKAIEAKLDTMEAAIRQKGMVAEFSCRAAPAEAMSAVKRMIVGSGYHLEPVVGDAEERSALVATRHRVQRWGSYVAHVALVVILAGGLIKAAFGFVEMVPVLEGRSRELQNKRGWEVFVDKFTVKYYDGTRNPKLFSSQIRVTENGKQLAEKLITVNDPLDVSGTRFYQASWGAGGMFREVILEVGEGKFLPIPQRKPTLIPGTPIKVTADVMMPNFTLTPDGRADTASLDLKNPAVRFRFDVGGKLTRSLWLLQFNPTVAFSETQDGVLVHAPDPPMKLADVEPILFSGIQVAYDPGYPLVAAGSIAWLLGTVLLFYMHRRRLWVLINPAEGGSRVLIGAWSSRGDVGFKKEFGAYVDRLKAGIGPAGSSSGPGAAFAGNLEAQS